MASVQDSVEYDIIDCSMQLLVKISDMDDISFYGQHFQRMSCRNVLLVEWKVDKSKLHTFLCSHWSHEGGFNDIMIFCYKHIWGHSKMLSHSMWTSSPVGNNSILMEFSLILDRAVAQWTRGFALNSGFFILSTNSILTNVQAKLPSCENPVEIGPKLKKN